MDTVQFADGSSLIMGGSRVGERDPDPWKITKIFFFYNTGPDPVKKKSQSYKCTKPALHDGPSLVRQRNAF